MKTIDNNYLNGKFMPSNGTEIIEIFNPANNQQIGKVVPEGWLSIHFTMMHWLLLEGSNNQGLAEKEEFMGWKSNWRQK